MEKYNAKIVNIELYYVASSFRMQKYNSLIDHSVKNYCGLLFNCMHIREWMSFLL